MSESLPLSALLSRALVAFTIELDNTWESRMAHRTTRFGGPRGAVYAASLARWSNFMRAVPAEGVSVAELERRVRARLPLDGMRRWKYVTIAPDPDPDPGRARVPRRDWRITPTRAGLEAQAVWRGLPEEIEQRWAERFGADAVAGLRADLEQLVGELGLADLPQWLTGHYGGDAGQALEWGRQAPAADEWPLPLSVLLCQVLQAFALEYEAESDAALSYSADVLRLLDEDWVRVAELPRRSGVAVEALRVAVQILASGSSSPLGQTPAGDGSRWRGCWGEGRRRRGCTASALPSSRPAGAGTPATRRSDGCAPHSRRSSPLRVASERRCGRASCRRRRAGAAGWRRRTCYRTSRCHVKAVTPTEPDAPPIDRATMLAP